MAGFNIAVVASAFLCTLVAGFLFAFAVVVMPGTNRLDDRAFIRAFQVSDGIIQDNNPLFLLVWLGSALALIVCAFLGLDKLHGVDFYLLLVATIGYLVGVQVVTIVVHLPLNNQLQLVKVDSLSGEELAAARNAFEPRWNRSNRIRTAIACITSMCLIVLAVRL